MTAEIPANSEEVRVPLSPISPPKEPNTTPKSVLTKLLQSTKGGEKCEFNRVLWAYSKLQLHSHSPGESNHLSRKVYSSAVLATRHKVMPPNWVGSGWDNIWELRKSQSQTDAKNQ